MVEFSVPAAGGSRAEFRFSVAGHMVLVAGSRHLEVDGRTCRDLLEGLHLAGFHFFILKSPDSCNYVTSLPVACG